MRGFRTISNLDAASGEFPGEVWRAYPTCAGVDRPGGGQPARPRGVCHLRVLGAHTTLCGLAALNWPIIWEWRPGSDEADVSCLDCRRRAESSRPTGSGVSQ